MYVNGESLLVKNTKETLDMGFIPSIFNVF